MTWQDRIKPAGYTSPSGQRMAFIYDDVGVEFDKQGASFTFPDAPGTYVQDLGRTGRRFPFTLYFSGNNCDLQANIFMAMLGESGVGKLEHPMYGTYSVVPFGQISRDDNLQSAANQVVIKVTFWETTGLVYPTSQADAASDVLRAVEAYNQALAAEFAASVRLNTPSAKAGLYGDFSASLGRAKLALQRVANSSETVKRQFTTIERSIVTNLDELIGDPLVLALQATLFVQSPSRALTARIESRLDAYSAVVSIIADTVEQKGYGPRSSNRFKARDLFVSGAISGEVLSVVNNQFNTKSGALLAADTLLNQMTAVTAWREANYNSLEEVDTGAAYTALQSAVAFAAGYLVEISFTLKQERAITLDRARSIIDLVAELYGSVDEELDFFITSNNLTGSDILELPTGRKIVYYL